MAPLFKPGDWVGYTDEDDCIDDDIVVQFVECEDGCCRGYILKRSPSIIRRESNLYKMEKL